MSNKISQPNCKDQWSSYKTCQKFPSCIKSRKFNFLYLFFLGTNMIHNSPQQNLAAIFFHDDQYIIHSFLAKDKKK